jgi:hypothetical protein
MNCDKCESNQGDKCYFFQMPLSSAKKKCDEAYPRSETTIKELEASREMVYNKFGKAWGDYDMMPVKKSFIPVATGNGIIFHYNIEHKKQHKEITDFYIENTSKSNASVDISVGTTFYAVEVDSGQMILVSEKIHVSDDDDVYITSHTFLEL